MSLLLSWRLRQRERIETQINYLGSLIGLGSPLKRYYFSTNEVHKKQHGPFGILVGGVFGPTWVPYATTASHLSLQIGNHGRSFQGAF